MKKTLSLLLITVFFITSCGKKNTPNPTPVNPTTPTVNVSTFAGSGIAGATNGTGTAASFNKPNGVGIDINGNVYVADVGNVLIRKITPAGAVTTFAGSGANGATNGTGVLASFFAPIAVTVDEASNVYVADFGNSLIREISPLGVVTTLAGTGLQGAVNGTGTAASFNGPVGLAVDASGNIYVADIENELIRKITSGGVVTTFAGSGVAGAGNGTGTGASFDGPHGIALDAAGDVYIADQGNNLIRKITPAGVVTTFAGSGAAGAANGTGTAASFNAPQGVAVDASGNIYVADTGNNLIRKITTAGVVTTIAGNGFKGAVNGTGTAASFNGPLSIAIDATGNLYVADDENNLIRKISF